MAFRHSSTTVSSLTNAYTTYMAGYNYFKALFYTGTQPASANSMATGTLIGTLQALSNGNASVSGNVITGPTWVPANAVASGTVGYIRFVYSNSNTPLFDMAVGSEVFINNPTYAVGDPLILSPIQITIQ